MAEKLLKVEMTQVCKSCGEELPIEMFRVSRLGRYNTCNECVKKHQVQSKLDKKLKKFNEKSIEDARSLRLKDFQPRELMVELKRRGYKFKMEFTETHVIDSDSL